MSERPVQRVILEMRGDGENERVPEDLDQDQKNDNHDDEGEDDEKQSAIVLFGELVIGKYQQSITYQLVLERFPPPH